MSAKLATTSSQALTRLKGVGLRLAQKLQLLNIQTLNDLLFHLPYRYQDRSRIYTISQLAPGMQVLIEAEVVKQQIVFGKRRRLEVELADSTGYIYMSLFHFSDAQRKQLQTGTCIRCFGEINFFNQRLQMVHPEYEVTEKKLTPEVSQTLTPVYPTTEGISQKMWRKMITQVLSEPPHLPDFLPKSLTPDYSLLEALIYCHQPPIDANQALLEKGEHPAQQRLAQEELLAHHLSLRISREKMKLLRAPILEPDHDAFLKFQQQTPFTPTNAQLRVLQEITQDLAKPHPMLRLLQGDVGSGKTWVAAGSMLPALQQGYQVALMAPTEILAEQHVHNLTKYFSGFNFSIQGLTSRMPAPQKQMAYENIASGNAQVIIGTHALIQDAVQYQRLGLVIIDEQHRFGVKQRLTLQSKGFYPHQLIMTATPIPRTLAMTAYADLDYSVIDELPPQKKPITTIAISNSKRDTVIEKLRAYLGSKQQAYWVCTLIEESETLNCQTATQTYENLKLLLPEFNIGLIHGQLKNTEKQHLMTQFKAHAIDLLVATTVIEVGVDVPNANVMIIENPERLGLAQLHQLRGRVGRGAHPGHCILLYQSPLSFHAKSRLDIMRQTQDGFKIAEKDLALRGSGEFLGTKQSGEHDFKIANLNRDQIFIDQIETIATQLLQHHPDNIAPLIERWLGSKLHYGLV